MAQYIDVPGKGVIEFPDGMDSDAIGAAIQTSFPDLSPKMGAWDTAKAIGGQIGDAATHHLPGAVAAAIEGDAPYAERDWKDAMVERSRAKSQERAQAIDPTKPTAIPGVTAGDVGNLGPSLGFSGVGMAAGLGVGVPAAIAGTLAAPGVGTAAGIVAGGGASGLAAHRMSTNQFVRDLRETVDADRKQRGEAPIGDDEFAAKATELAPLISEYGLWEAVPEAAGNVIGFGVLKAPVAGAIGKAFGKNIATRLASKAAALYGSELATETVTQQGQHNVEVDAGMVGGPRRDWADPADIGASFKEVAAPTILQTTLMGGAAKGGMMAYDRLRGQQPTPVDNPAAPPQPTTMPRSQAALSQQAQQVAPPVVAAPVTGADGVAAAPPPEAETSSLALPAVGSAIAFTYAPTGATLNGTVREAGMVETEDGPVPNVVIQMPDGRVLDTPLADIAIGVPSTARQVPEAAVSADSVPSPVPSALPPQVATTADAYARAILAATDLGGEIGPAEIQRATSLPYGESVRLLERLQAEGIANRTSRPAPVAPPSPASGPDPSSAQQAAAANVPDINVGDMAIPVTEQAIAPSLAQPVTAPAEPVSNPDELSQAEAVKESLTDEPAETVKQEMTAAPASARPQPSDSVTVLGDGSRTAPVVAVTPDHVAAAAARAETEPSDAQKEAGNYTKGHMRLRGLDITVENAKGSVRRGTAPDGAAWQVEMPAAYGYVKRTEGADGDQVDVYIGDRPESDVVAVVDQIDPSTNRFDEHKVVLGAADAQEAIRLYDGGFSDGSGPRRRGAVTAMTMEAFKDWLRGGDTTKPLAWKKPKLPAERRAAKAARASDKKPWQATAADLDPRWASSDYAAMTMDEFLAQAKLSEQISATKDAKTPAAKRAAFDKAGRTFNSGAYRHMHPEGKAVEEAVAAGNAVPERVLAEYPDLAKPTPAKIEQKPSAEIDPQRSAAKSTYKKLRDGSWGAYVDTGYGHSAIARPNPGDIITVVTSKGERHDRAIATVVTEYKSGMVVSLVADAHVAAKAKERYDAAVKKGSENTAKRHAKSREQLAREYDRIHNEGGEGYNPYRDNDEGEGEGGRVEMFQMRDDGNIRSLGIPKQAEPAISSHKSAGILKAHADYRAAKAGDAMAAGRLVLDLVGRETLDTARARFGADTIFVPATAEEASGRNAIPAALANIYATATGGRADGGIVQSTRAHHTGAGPIQRLLSRPLFAGPVTAGGRYVLVDDVSTMGGTLAEMANHIRANGGEVAGVVVLANASRTGVLSPKNIQVREIERRYGDVVREVFGIDPSGLTADEATYILNFRDADSLRARAAKGEGARGVRGDGRDVRASGAEDGGLAKSRVGGASAPSKSDAAATIAALEPALRARLSALGLSGTVTLQVVEAVRSMTTGKAQAGAAGSFFENIIQVAAGGSNPMLTLNHEAIHALRANNILRGMDWKALERMARADATLMAEVNERWGHLNLSRESLAEEAVAEMFATWATGRAPKGIVGRAFERVAAFFTALRAALKEAGLLDAIAEGRIAFRATGVMQDADRGAMAPSREQGVRFTADKSAVAAKFNMDSQQPSDPVVDALPPSLRARAMEIIRTDASAVAGKLFKPEKAGAGVEVIEAQTADDISWFKAKLYTPEAIFRRLAKSTNPRTATVGTALYKLWQKAVKAETDQSEYIHRLRRDVSTIRNEVADEDWTATQALLFQGDAAGIEYTPDQTAAMVASGDLTAPAAAAYHRMRRFFKKLGEFVDQHERKMKPALRKQKFALIRKMARRLGLDQDEFRRRYAYLSDLRAQLARGDGDPEYLGSKISEAEALLRLDEEGLDWPIVEQWDRELQAIDRRLASLSVQRREGYVPHKFYGSWAIYEVETTEDGDDVLRLLPAYRSDKVRGGQAVQVEEGFHQSRDDAVRAANQHAARNQDKRLVVKPVEFKFPGSDATVVSDASLRHIMRQAEDVAEQFGLDAEVMVESLNGVVKVRNRRRNASFKNKRAGIAGYSKELDRVIDTHVGEVVRYVVMDELKYDAINTFERTGLSRNRSVIQENPTLATYVEQWFSDINGQKQGAERQLDALLSKPWARPLNVAMATGTAAFLAGGGIVGSPAVGLAVGSYVGYRFYRSLKDGGDFKTRAVTGAMLGDMAHLKLGAFTNVMSAVVNLSQTTMNTWPVLGSKWTAIGIKRYTKAMTDMLRGKANHDITLLRRGNVDTAFKISEVSPHLFEQDSKLARASMFLFNQAESLNRGVAFLGAYARAEAQGHPPGKAMAYARRMLTRTQFHYGAANKPEVLRNTLLRVPLQFKNFLAQQLTFMAGLNKREAAKFMLALFLMAGLIGMPGAEMLDALTEWLFGFSPLVEVKRLMFDAAAKGELAGGIATMLVHGLPALAGLDISSRVGMSQIIPDEGRDLQGPWWSTIATAARHGAEGASLVDQIRNLSPGIGNPLKMVEASANGLPVTAWPREAAKALAGEDSAFTDDKAVLTSPYKRGRVEYEPRSGEMAMKALGAMPMRESELRDLNAVTLHDSQRDKKFTGRHIDRIIRAIKDGDDPSPLYEAAADDGVTITKAKIKNALKQDGLTRMERAFSQMPDATESWAREVYGRITEEE